MQAGGLCKLQAWQHLSVLEKLMEEVMLKATSQLFEEQEDNWEQP